MMRLVYAEGTHKKIGYDLGYQLKEDIQHNIILREQDAHSKGIDNCVLSRIIHTYAALSSPSSLQLMEGMSKGSGVPFESLLRFNALQDIFSPEECTSFAAVGKATSNGKAFLLKNRDHRYYEDNTISVFQVMKTADQNVIASVTVAGSTSVKMGINRYGLAVCSNTGPTNENVLTELEPNQLSRGEVLKEALACTSAKDAVKYTLGRLVDSQMQIPGILFLVDAHNIYVIEADHTFAVIHITDGCIVRANRFLVVENNDTSVEKEISSICRYLRGKQLLKENNGQIDREKILAFSVDHKNGPYNNSICRHDRNQKESPTVSAGIMEMDSKYPEKSRISIALGSPCWAWAHSDGNFTFQMDEDSKSIPQRFLDGTNFKEFIKSGPFRD